MNGYFLTLTNDEIRNLVVSVASYRERGETFDQIMASTQSKLRKNLVPVRVLRRVDMAFYRRVLRRRQGLLRFSLALVDTPLRQRG